MNINRAMYLNKNDAVIERDDKDYPNSAVLYDEEWNFLFRFNDEWTDEQILTALDFANKAHAHGYNRGKADTQNTIKLAIGL